MASDPEDRFKVFEPVQQPPRPRVCAWPGCDLVGEHRAPASRERLNDYRWFCLEHVRLYNSSWNYYKGMTDAQMEASIRSDTTWNRPTWPLGGREADAAGMGAIHDPMGIFEGRGGAPDPRRRAQAPVSRLSPQDRQAFDVLDLEFPASFDEVKARYKVLVKLHHPDANGGAKEAEERLKVINEAFETLKNGFFA